MDDAHEIENIVRRCLDEKVPAMVRRIMNEGPPRLTIDQVRQVVKDEVSDKMIMMGVNAETPQDMIKLQRSFTFLINLRRFADAVGGKILWVLILGAFAGWVLTSKMVRTMLGQ